MEIWLSLEPRRRLQLVFDLCEGARELAIAGLRLRLPGLTEPQIRRLWSDQALGQALAARVFGPIDFPVEA